MRASQGKARERITPKSASGPQYKKTSEKSFQGTQMKKGGLRWARCSVTEGLHTILQDDVLTVTSWHTHAAILSRLQTPRDILAHRDSILSSSFGHANN